MLVKKHLLLIMAALSAFSAEVQADKGFTLIKEKSVGVAVSPNGQYVVGNNKADYVNNVFMKSFVFDTTDGTKQLKWLTEYDETDLTKGGEFTGVSDNGIICGTSKDAGFKYEGDPINAAAVWTIDGKRTLLGYGDFDMTTIKKNNDGAFATAISADGKTVAGEFKTSNGAYLTPCVWTQTDNGEWLMSMLPMPEGAKGGQTTAVSADGKTVGGYVRLADSSRYPVLWKDGKYTIYTDKALGLADAATAIGMSAMSANGRFIVVSPTGGLSYIYDTEKGELRDIPIMDYLYSSHGDMFSGISDFGIDNEGNVVYSISYYGGSYWLPLWYSYNENRSVSLTFYIDTYASGVEPEISFSADDMSPAKTVAMSADGNIIVGNVDNAFEPQLWVLKSEKNNVRMVDTPTGVKATATGTDQVTLTWNKDMNSYDGLTLKSYNIYCNGENVKNVPVTEGTVMTAVIDNVPSGKPGFEVEAVFEKTDGSTVLSPRSNPVQVILAADWSMPLYEDFSSGGIDLNSWEIMYTPESQNNFSFSIDDSYGMGWTYGLAMRTSPGNPYSVALASRQIDAQKAETVHMSFYVNHGLINISDQDLSNDMFSIETSTDGGATWEEIKTWDAESLSPSTRQWTFMALDLTKAVAGKTFRVRLHMHGPGTSYFYLGIDNISINAEPQHEAPTGLINEKINDGKAVRIAWKNASGAYNLNFINENPTYRFTLGNAGKELIGANKFEQEDLKMFDGKYLTAVNTKINYYDGKTGTNGIKANIVVYENGTLIREQEIKVVPYNVYFTTALDQPLKIDADKELMIGIKVYNYDADQIPLCYVQSLDYLPGKSDLFSEDGGKTWQLVSDFYKTQEEPAQGWCCWDITGYITDEPELTATGKTEPFSYIVYRNGEQCSVLTVSGKSARFTDNEPADNACYEVVAYYQSGEYSETSEQMNIGELTSIEGVANDEIKVEVATEGNNLSVKGNYDNAVLITTDGVCVARSNGNSMSAKSLVPGVYLLKIEKDGKSSVRKIMVNR